MPHPPRFAHLLTRSLVISKLVAPYAESHAVDDEEAAIRLERAVKGALLDDLLDATWNVLVDTSKSGDTEALLDKVAKSVASRGMKPGRPIELNLEWNAFLLIADIEAGTASDAARTLLETERGRKLAKGGLAEAGRYLASEFTRK